VKKELWWCICNRGTCKMRNETRNETCETERNETKFSETKSRRNEI